VGYLPRFAESGTEIRRCDHGRIILDEERAGGAADQKQAEEERGEEAGHGCVESIEFGVLSIVTRGKRHFTVFGGFSPAGNWANLSSSVMSWKNQGFPDLILKMTVRLA
jgi:hypothetical protein